MKMDDLYLSDFREMRLKSKGDFDIAYSTVMGIGFNAYLKKFIFSSQGFGCDNFKSEKSYISHFMARTGNSALSRNITIFHQITYLIFFSNKIRTKLSKTLLVILQFRIRFRHKLYIA